MRTALIGCGQVMEEGHLPALRDESSVDVVAFVDVVPERGAAFAGRTPWRSVPVYQTPAAMLAELQVDAAIVATPPAYRLSTVEPLVSAGVAVLIEKPVAATPADAESLVQLDESSEAVMMMCHNYAFFEEYRLVAELLATDAIGPVTGIAIQALGSYGWDGVREFRPGWRHDATVSGGGRLLDTGWHALYLTELFARASFAEVTASAEFAPAYPVDRRCYAIYRLGEIMATMAVGEGQGPVGFEVVGRNGRLRLNFSNERGDFGAPPRAVEVYRDGVLTATHPVPARGMMTGGLYREWRRRIDSGDRPYEHSPAHGRDILNVALATYAAAASGRRIPITAGRTPAASAKAHSA